MRRLDLGLSEHNCTCNPYLYGYFYIHAPEFIGFVSFRI